MDKRSVCNNKNGQSNNHSNNKDLRHPLATVRTDEALIDNN